MIDQEALPDVEVLQRLRAWVSQPYAPGPADDLFLLLGVGDVLLNAGAYRLPLPALSREQNALRSVHERRAAWHVMTTLLDWDVLMNGLVAGLSVMEIAACLRAGLSWPEVKASLPDRDRWMLWAGLAALRA